MKALVAVSAGVCPKSPFSFPNFPFSFPMAYISFVQSTQAIFTALRAPQFHHILGDLELAFTQVQSAYQSQNYKQVMELLTSVSYECAKLTTAIKTGELQWPQETETFAPMAENPKSDMLNLLGDAFQHRKAFRQHIASL